MRKFISKIVLFAIVAASGFLLWLSLLGGTGLLRTVNYRLGNYGHLYTRASEAAGYGPVDILFLGSSHAYRTFDTRYFDSLGYRTFNLGSSNQTPVQTYVLLQQYLIRLNPKLVVFEVHPDIMAYDGVEGAVDLLSNVPITPASASMALDYRNLKVINTFCYSLIRQWFCGALDHFEEDSIVEGWAYVPGGFVYIPQEPVFVPDSIPLQDIQVLPEQVQSLSKCLDLLRHHDIPFILVEVPSSHALSQSYANYGQYTDLMATFGPFYQLPLLPTPDSLYFTDPDHLNHRGVQIVCSQVADLIESQHLLAP